jgi:nicotinamidase-related amidase
MERFVIIPTRDNSVILFLDLQEEIVKNSRTVPVARLERTAGALAKLAALHKLPVFMSAVPPGGAFLPTVTEPLPGVTPSMRTQTTAFADPGLISMLEAAGRKLLLLSGVASEIVVQRTALDAIAAGYDVLVAVDACGGIDARTEDAAWRRMTAAGGATTSAITFAAELAGDFTTEAGGATLGIMYELLAG